MSGAAVVVPTAGSSAKHEGLKAETGFGQCVCCVCQPCRARLARRTGHVLEAFANDVAPRKKLSKRVRRKARAVVQDLLKVRARYVGLLRHEVL